jgi:hypothetical protein
MSTPAEEESQQAHRGVVEVAATLYALFLGR